MDGFEDPYESLAFWLRDNKGLVIFLVFLFVFILCCVAYIVRVQLRKKKSYTFRLYSENLNKSGWHPMIPNTRRYPFSPYSFQTV